MNEFIIVALIIYIQLYCLHSIVGEYVRPPG